MSHCKCPDDISGTPAWRFRMLSHAHRSAVGAALSECGVTEPGQPFILFSLACEESGGLDTQRELANKMRLSPATVTASLKTLEKQGCVRRVTDENDMRRKRIEITDKGRETADRCRRAFARVDEAMYFGFSPEELEFLSSYLDRMTANLSAMCEKEDCRL